MKMDSTTSSKQSNYIRIILAQRRMLERAYNRIRVLENAIDTHESVKDTKQEQSIESVPQYVVMITTKNNYGSTARWIHDSQNAYTMHFIEASLHTLESAREIVKQDSKVMAPYVDYSILSIEDVYNHVSLDILLHDISRLKRFAVV